MQKACIPEAYCSQLAAGRMDGPTRAYWPGLGESTKVSSLAPGQTASEDPLLNENPKAEEISRRVP